ncbi:MAG TPA: UPF0149 family protein [Caldimonas sp.]|jgi:uncharacterized protein|nr:UPF0149 family protein [Caldimonas sp.]HEX4233502.1 UPF0149 family protein [Caldimonas sp.]
MTQPESAPPSRGALAAADQDLSEAELAELDALLATVPEPLEPLDAVMLDGFLCCVIVQPAIVESDNWLPYVFDAGGHRWGEAEPGDEQRRARALVLRRHAALNRALAEYGSFEPLLLQPDADNADEQRRAADDPIGAILRPWVAGFEQALQVLPALVDLDDSQVRSALARVLQFLPDDAADETDSARPSAKSALSLDQAIDHVVSGVAELYEWTLPLRYKVEVVRHAAPKVGRNDPCPCGSGRKFKHCHGAAAA